jgi:hypothetical protein
MRSRSTIARGTLAAASCALLMLMGNTAGAQFGGGFGRGGMGGEPPGGPPNGGKMDRRNPPPSDSAMADDPTRQLDQLHYQFRLRPEQEKAWAAYQKRIESLLDDGQRERPLEVLSEATAIRQIDTRIDRVRNRLAALEDVADAARALYAQLDESQRALADRLLVRTLPSLLPGGPENQGGKSNQGREGQAPPR